MRRLIVAALALVTALASDARAHGAGFLGTGEVAHVHQELIAVFGEGAAFAATATVTSKRVDGTRTERFPYQALEGRFRFERNVADNPFLYPYQIEHHRRQGTDVSVTLIDAEGMYVLFPRLKAYFRSPRRAETAPLKIERRESGEETIDGRPCRKVEIVVADATGPTSIVVWEARDEQGMPIRVVNRHGDDETTLDLSEFGPAPDASAFEVPSDYVGYDNVRKLLAERGLESKP